MTQTSFGISSDKMPRYYPATYLDADTISGAFSSSPPSISVGERVIFCVGGVIDLPISIVTDTLLLPYDACRSDNEPPNTALEPTPTAP